MHNALGSRQSKKKGFMDHLLNTLTEISQREIFRGSHRAAVFYYANR